MAVTTLGREIVKSALPQKYKSYAQDSLTKGKLQNLTTSLAKEDPDAYIQILHKLNHIGQTVVSNYGKDTTVTLDDLDAGAQVKRSREKLQQLVKAILQRKDLTTKQKQQKVIQLGYKYTSKLKDLGLQDANKRKTGIANQIASGSRGNPVQLMQLIIGDMQMRDAANRDIPYLATMPYVDGDSPMSYWASGMSGRKSTYDTQAATGNVGYLSKQATNTVHNTPIIMQDCGTTDTGIPVNASDVENVGSMLLNKWRNYPAGTFVTQQMLQKANDDQQFIVRSPTTCKAKHGVCAKCAGIQQNGKLPVIGSYVALNAVKSFVQPLTQVGISCLHPDTPVRMSYGSIKALKQIKVGDTVIGVSKDGVSKSVKVTHTFNNGIQPVYLFTYSNGYTKLSIACTQQHKLLQIIEDQTNKPKILPAGYKCKDIAVLKLEGMEYNKGFTGQENLIPYKLVEKKFLGQMQTRDIEVDHPDHLFLLGNGIICSNSKHGSGMGGKKVQDPDGDDQPTGFDSIKRMLLAPSTFPGGAVLSQVDGRISAVRPAPQGGNYITVGTTTIYSPRVRRVTVKVGDTVQAGDMLTNGVPNPMQIVKYKGIGQGRQYFMNKLFQLLPNSSAGTTRRNLQQFSRAMINKVKITQEQGFKGHYPGDIVDYDDITSDWQPRENSKEMSTKDATGKYLQKPVLYFSIGTRITPNVAKKLQKYGYNKILVNQKQPPFQPQFISSKSFVLNDRNWLPRLNGQRLKEAVFDAARKGITDQYNSPSFIDKIIVSPFNPAENNKAGN